MGSVPSMELRLNPPFIHYFFQHPWGIGVPIFCLVVLQRAALPRVSNQTLGLAALICSLSLLSLSEAVLFVTTVVALGLTEAWRLARFRERSAAVVLLGIGVSLLGAKLIGGFFVAGPFPPAGGFFDTGFYVRDFAGPNAVLGQAQWNFASFGLLPVLGVVGLLRVKHEKVLLIILAGLTLFVVNSLRYKYTWDIVKFGTVSFIALAIGAGVALSGLANWADSRRRRLVLGLIVIALVGQGVAYPFVILGAYDPELRPRFSLQMIRPYFSLAYPVDRDDAQAVSFLRTHMGPSEIAYRAQEKSEPYAIWGGLPTQVSVYTDPAENRSNDAYGLGEEKLAARRDLASISEGWFDKVLAEHITWLVTDGDDVAINALLECPEGRDRAVLAARYGKVRVFRIR